MITAAPGIRSILNPISGEMNSMENIQTQIPASAPGKSPSTSSAVNKGCTPAHDAPLGTMDSMGFQKLLLGMMGLQSTQEAAIEPGQKAGIAADDTENLAPIDAPAGASNAMPLPIMPPPPAPLRTAGETPALSGITGDLPAAAASTTAAATNAFDHTGKAEPGTVEPHGKGSDLGLEQNPPQSGKPDTGTHAEGANTTGLQRSLEAISEHRDAAVSNLPVPHAQGVHPPLPTHPLPSAPDRIDVLIGTPDWNTECAQKIVWMQSQKQQSAELHINPPDLGPLHIRLTTDETQTSAIFTSPHGEVREALEAALPRLREVLADSGITLGNASVTADSPRDGSAFAQPRHSPRPESSAPDADTKPEPFSPRLLPRPRGNGLVDLFA